MNKVAFWEGFEKQALNLRSARRAVNALKPNIIKKDMGTVISSRAQRGVSPFKTGPATLIPFKNQTSTRMKDHPFRNVPSSQRKIFAKGPMSKAAPRSSELSDPLRKMDPKNKEMTNRVTLMHEGLERKALKQQKGNNYNPNKASHANLGVILRENNMVSTLPKGFEDTKKVFSQMRDMDNTKNVIEKAVPGFQYGKTRLSRHAVKRVEQTLKRKGEGPKTLKEMRELRKPKAPSPKEILKDRPRKNEASRYKLKAFKKWTEARKKGTQ